MTHASVTHRAMAHRATIPMVSWVILESDDIDACVILSLGMLGDELCAKAGPANEAAKRATAKRVGIRLYILGSLRVTDARLNISAPIPISV